ncbi:hypothetical protein [Shewanella polaris]|uniref:Uncharacterized protein n=1 Tax=Shewanella polaris TaxID=2588449 RepID=A0A4Y5YCL6_9GAMM|nr:hypothetical protein [Shewanella polaris]QDE30309.1 hypothetical protein FH971_04575 [Shewanella polaris]
MNKHPHDFNNYHDVNEDITETLRPSQVKSDDNPSQVETTKNPSLNIEDNHENDSDNETLQRRDLIVYNLYYKRNLKSNEFINHLISVIPTSTDTIMKDIASLKSPETFKKHKNRVKQSLINRGERKAELMLQGTKAINEAMEKSIKFDSDMLVDLSIRYECNPRQIVDEIIRYKKISTQVAIKKNKKQKLPVMRALVKCAKLNIKY